MCEFRKSLLIAGQSSIVVATGDYAGFGDPRLPVWMAPAGSEAKVPNLSGPNR